MAEDVKDGWLSRARYRAGRIGEPLFPIAGATVLAVSGHVDGSIGLLGWEPAATALLIAVGALLLLIGAILVARRTIPLERLQSEEPELRNRADLGATALLRLARVELRGLARKAAFASNERVSLYREESDGFTLIGRYSPRPAFAQSLGRVAIPRESGVIGRAWAHGSAAETDLPAPGAGPHPSRDWLAAQEQRCGVPSEVAAEFAMWSQAYVAFRLGTEDRRSHGAIVFESTLSLAQASTGPAPPLLTVPELEDLVKEASERLTQIVIETRHLPRAEIRSLLELQQGPNPVA